MSEQLRLCEIQRLFVSGYGRLPWAVYHLLEVTEAGAARAWLGTRAAHVTWADAEREPALNIAFTHPGLAALGLAQEALRSFPFAFQDGMASARRSRLLGDTGPNHPEKWVWGGPRNRAVHVLLLLFARTRSQLEDWRAAHEPPPGSGLRTVALLPCSEPGPHDPEHRDHREHFGFTDGIAEPLVAGTEKAHRRHGAGGQGDAAAASATAGRAGDGSTFHPSAVLAPGEFLLGYRDERGQHAPTPWVPGAHAALPRVQRDANRGDLGRDGTYLVFRQLAQDVAGFWDGIHEEARRLYGDDPLGPERLAAKLVGRWPSGAPLIGNPSADPAAHEQHRRQRDVATDDFGFAHDPHGEVCPRGAHLRRANPRDALGSQVGAQALAATRRRSLIRRGRNYGTRLEESGDPNAERGLHFICLNADLERQFEFVQRMWLQNPGFATLPDEVDPLVGTPAGGAGCFTMPQAPVCRRALAIRSHVTVRGGAYWFMPGRAALRFLTG